MEKNLPIKFFSKRTIDERDTEGGGGKAPQWVLSGEPLDNHAADLIESLKRQSSIFDERKQKKTEFIPAVLQLEVKEAAIAKSYRSDIGSLFADDENQLNLIGFKGKNDVLVKIDTLDDLNKVVSRLSQPKKYRYNYGISAIDEIKAFSPEIILGNNPIGKTLEIDLINFQNYNLNKAVEALFEDLCKQLNVDFKRLNYSSELINYKIANLTKEALEGIVQFDALKEVEFMPEFQVTFDTVVDSNVESIPVKRPVEGKSYPTIGILDSGIAPIANLQPWISTQSIFGLSRKPC